MGRKNKKKKEEAVSYGAVALSGYIYQTLYAIMAAMEDPGWDQIKVEPVTSEGKTDIAFYRDDAYEAVNITLSGRQKLYKKIQVKKRSDEVRIRELEKWFEELRGDDPAESCEVCLFGKPKYEGKLPQNVRVIENDIDQVQEDVKDKIKGYCKAKGVERCSDWDLEVASGLLFKKLTMNALERDPITKKQLEGIMAGILVRSPEYIAEAIRIISQRRFMENPGYERDLKPARLDENGRKNMEAPPTIRPEEFPEVRFAADSEECRFNLFDYVKAHIEDKKITRHIYLSGESGCGKSTCIYYLWKEYLGDEAVIPVYVPLYKLRKSITSYIVSRYTNLESSVDFDKFKKLLLKMSRQIVLFLDGYNELAANINDEVQEEIKKFFCIDQVTVIITSTDEGMTLKEDITELRMCCLSNSQIKNFLGGYREYLPEKHYEGMLTNPFMLEKVIESFGDQKEKFDSIFQISKAKVLRKYINNQMNNIELRPEDKIGLNVVLPLVSMKMDEKIHSGNTALVDPKQYGIVAFESAAEAVREDLKTYSALIRKESGTRFGGIDYTSKVLGIEDWVKWLCDAGKALEIFNQDSDISIEVAWDHEIYRDYYIAKGYAIYCTYNEDVEDCVHNLAKQINCGYRDPVSGESEVKPSVREHLVSKVQMFIDMVDESSEGYNNRLKELNESVVYRRLTRDTALIYEDMDVFNMVAASELSLRHYRDVQAICKAESQYDYEDKDRRMVEAAFSISELAYIFMHEKVPGEDKRKYLEYARENLARADDVFCELEKKGSKILKDRTVRNYWLINQGNHAAYLFAEAKIAGDEKKKNENFEKALVIHLSNLKERESIRAEINGEEGNDSEIRCSIAKSYIGIATAYYKMGKYKESIENNKKAVEISPDHNDQIRGCRNIGGNYSAMREYEKEDLSEAVRWIGEGIRLVKEYRAYSYYSDLKKNLLKITASLSEEHRAYIREKLLDVETEMRILDNKSYNV